MTKMRAMWVLAAVLSFATPQVSWSAIETALSGSNSIVLATPAAGPAPIVRAVGKTCKTFSSGLALPSAVELPQPHGYAIDCVPDAPADPPNLRLDELPLSPRPPPHF
jgi:hypothetical protein